MNCPQCGHSNPVDVVECESCDELLVDIFASRAAPSFTPSTKVVGEELATGALLGDRYEVLDLIGEGGMGRVYKVRDRELDKVIALKLIRSEQSQDPTVIQRFKQELLLARNVTHKNVVRLYDLGEENGFKFFTMEWIEGENLKERIRREGALSVEAALPLIRQMIEALQEAHRQGVVHRDLKPQNVMLDGNGDPHIMDFGIARTVDTNTMTATGAVMGTPDYMSPEQAFGEKADQQSDLFSLGVICYEMLTGELPYQAESPLSRVVMRITKKPKTPRELKADLPVFLEKVVLKCMEMDKELRYQSAGEILHDLDEEQVDAAFGLRLRRAVGRRKGILASAAVFLSAVVAALYFVGRPAPPPEAVEDVPVKTLAILPFTNATASEELDWMRNGLPEMLFTDISQSKFVRPVPGERLVKLLRGLGVEEMSRYDEATLASISELAAVQSVLYGQFVESDGTIRLDLFLRDAASGVPTPIRVQAKADQIFALVDDITTQIKAHLDLTPEQLKGDIDRPVIEVSTASLEALKAYQSGLAELRQGANQASILFFKEAVTVDSDFAMAHAKLAEAYLNVGEYGPAEEAVDRAQTLSETAALPLAERYQIHAITALAKEDYETAVTSYRELTNLFPEDPDVQLSLAQSLEKLGQWPEAEEAYRKVIGLDPNNGAALLGSGKALVVTGRSEEAVSLLESAVESERFQKDPDALGMVHSILGVAYRRMGQFDQAIEHLERSLSYREELDDKRGQASALTNLAAVYQTKGQIEAALRAERKAVVLAREIGDRATESIALLNLGLTYKMSGQLDEAFGAIRESMRIEREREDDANIAVRMDYIAEIYRIRGQYDDALVYLGQAREHLANSGDLQEKAFNFKFTGTVRKSQGFYDDAVKELLNALQIFKEIQQPSGVGEVQSQLAEIYSSQGRFKDAYQMLQSSLEISRELEFVYERAEAVAFWAHFLIRMGQFDVAETELSHAKGIVDRLRADELMPLIVLGHGDLLRLRGKNEEAAKIYRSAEQAATQLSQKEISILSRIELGRALLQGKDLAQAESVLQKAMDDSSKINSRILQAESAVELANVYAATGDAEAARAMALEAAQTAEPFSGRSLLLKANVILGSSLEKLRRTEEAVSAYSKAVEILKEIEGNLPEPYVVSYMRRRDTLCLIEEIVAVMERAGRGHEVQSFFRYVEE